MISFMVTMVEIVRDRTPQRVLPNKISLDRHSSFIERTQRPTYDLVGLFHRQSRTLHAPGSERIPRLAALVQVSCPFYSRVSCYLLHRVRICREARNVI